MHISAEGKIGIALGLIGLAGGGAMMVAPLHTEIGWGLIGFAGVGVVLLAGYHWRELLAGAAENSKQTPSGVSPMPSATGGATEKTNYRTPSATELQFLRGRWWYALWAGWPFFSYQAQRRLEFIDSWTRYFDSRRTRSARSPADGAKAFLLEEALDYVVGEGPNLIYQLVMTREQVEKNLVARLPADTIKNLEQQLANQKAGLPPAGIAPTHNLIAGREFIPLSLSDFLKTFDDKPDSEKRRLLRVHRKSWLKISGLVNIVAGLDSSGIAMYLTPVEGNPPAVGSFPVYLVFDKRWAKRVALLIKDTPITIIGQPRLLVGKLLHLVHSEIVDGG